MSTAATYRAGPEDGPAEDLDDAAAHEQQGYAQPERPPRPAPPPSPVRHVSALLGVDQAAATFAHKFRAVGGDGQIWCILCPRDNPRPGQLPHLCCSYHIAEFRRGRR